VEEDVKDAVGIAGHQVAGSAMEHHVACIRCHSGLKRVVVPFHVAGGDADTCGLACLTIVDEDVIVGVGVTRN
jgi:hypothetical protein